MSSRNSRWAWGISACSFSSESPPSSWPSYFAGTITSNPAASNSFAVVYDAIDRRATAKTLSADFDLNYRPTDTLTVHFKAGWTKADGDTSNETFLETAGLGQFSHDLRSGVPEISFASPNQLDPSGMRPDFARMADLGVTSAGLADALRVATAGDYDQGLAKLNLSQRQVPVVVRLPA